MYRQTAEKLLNTISHCTCSFTTVQYVRVLLERDGYRELELENIADWEVKSGDKVYVNVYDSSVFAFHIGQAAGKNSENDSENAESNSTESIKIDKAGGKTAKNNICSLRFAAAHTDSPALYIKSNPEMTDGGYEKLNVEIYGAPILNTWLDRPLSAAGKIVLAGEDIFHPETIIKDMKKNLFTVPNLAIHLNREVNKGVELNNQKDMIPFCGISEGGAAVSSSFFTDYLARELDVKKDDILDYELYIYNNEEGCVLGLDNELISVPRIDNITSVEAIIRGLMTEDNTGDSAENNTGKYPVENQMENVRTGDNIIRGAILFDNEEIGSRTKQGADSGLLAMVTERIMTCLGFNREEYLSAVTNGFMLSADVAHGLHPNRGEKSDVTNLNRLNGGIVIKRACSQAYGTDSQSVAAVAQLCRTNGIPYQKFAGRSDVTLGSTLGGIANKYLPMRIVDVGVPILAMHSARETMGIKDQYYLEKLIKAFYNS